jgi:hypothetical protein
MLLLLLGWRLRLLRLRVPHGPLQLRCLLHVLSVPLLGLCWQQRMC